jgi:hypothetical protein
MANKKCWVKSKGLKPTPRPTLGIMRLASLSRPNKSKNNKALKKRSISTQNNKKPWGHAEPLPVPRLGWNEASIYGGGKDRSGSQKKTRKEKARTAKELELGIKGIKVIRRANESKVD